MEEEPAGLVADEDVFCGLETAALDEVVVLDELVFEVVLFEAVFFDELPAKAPEEPDRELFCCEPSADEAVDSPLERSAA